MNGQQLKNSILQLAIQGKLVPQDPNDEPASELLKRIRKEKERMVKEGKLKKKDLESEPITEEEIPFEIPESWKWVRMNDLAAYRKGPFGSSLTKSMFVPQSDHSIKVYEQKNAIQKDYRLGEYYITKEKYGNMEGFTVLPFDIIVSCAGTIGECYQLPAQAPLGVINQALMRVRLFEPSMAEYWMLFFADMLNHNSAMKGAGSAIKNIPPFEVLKNILVPIPPKEEQVRIVKRYFELMPLVNEYDEAQKSLDALNTSLPDQLKKSILQQAIIGKLVPQDPNDEPAYKLLQCIHQEKLLLVKQGKLKKKDLYSTPINDNEKPFDIPDSWEWVRLRDIFIMQAGKNISASNIHSEKDNVNMYPCYGGNGIRGYVSQFNNDGVFPIIGRQGALCGCINMAYDRFYATEHAVVVSYFAGTKVDFIKYFLIALNLNQYSTATAQPGLSMEKVSQTLFPLPPLPEQHRIVAKIEELFKEIG